MARDLEPVRSLEPDSPATPRVRLQITYQRPEGGTQTDALNLYDAQLPIFLEVWIDGVKVYGLSKNQHPSWDPRS